MQPEIAKAYLDGRLMLLLGAGASGSSMSSNHDPLPQSHELAAEMAQICGLQYTNEALSIVYSAIKDSDASGLESFLKRRLGSCIPGNDLISLLKYRWNRIYTLNVDDSLERAASKVSPQKYEVYGRLATLEDIDSSFDKLQIIKLNGSVDRLNEGLIFSPQEYGTGSNKLPPWYRELGQDYGNHIFVYIGSRLNEPLLHQVMSEMRGENKSPQRGYLISPSASTIEAKHLDSLKITHIPGTLDDFNSYLRKAVGAPPSAWDLAVAKRPELKKLSASGLPDDKRRALNAVLVVGKATLPRPVTSPAGAIRAFYRGFKPTWSDILDDVHARLVAYSDVLSVIERASGGQLVGILGPAGSGKTTALMYCALELSGRSNKPVYYLRDNIANVDNIIEHLEELNTDTYYLFIDRLDIIANDLYSIYQKQRVTRGVVVFAERKNIWRRRLQEMFGELNFELITIDRISKSDVSPILSKLRSYGPWTRLESMSETDRKKEIYEKSSRQLLIGLLESTNGIGFEEIIKRDYGYLGDKSHQKLLVTVGLATIHRTPIPLKILGRALEYNGVIQDVKTLLHDMDGVVESQNYNLYARHPVYIRELFEKIIDPELIRDCVISLLNAFSDYKAPAIRHVTKSEGFILKSVFNHKFLRKMMRNNESRVISIYSEFETTFYIDGLYWLQYGLALRGFGRHEEALEKFRTARVAYRSPQIEHAYAQQLLIMAERSGSWIDAEPLLQEAVSSFREQKYDTWETDTYPIVTLAEGHVSVYRKFHTLEESQELARPYANELQSLRKKYDNKRLNNAATNLATFVATGVWKEKDHTDDHEFDD